MKRSGDAGAAVLMLLGSALVAVAVESGGVGASSLGAASCLSEVRTVQREMVALMEEQRADLLLAKAQLDQQIRELKKDNEASITGVAFSTSFSTNTDRHIGPFQTDVTLKFDCVFTNIGNAYDKNTGIFTVPVNGVYQFNYHIFAGGDHGAGAKFFKNKDQVVAAYNHVAPHDINTSQSVVLQLEIGDQISLLLEKGWWVAAYRGHLTTFSGHLLFQTSQPSI